VVVSGHGSAAGGDEYEFTQDTVTLNGTEIGTFSTKIDRAAYAQASPRGNPAIFKNNPLGNPRNWRPGALVPSHTFEATLAAGDNTFSLGIAPSLVPEGSYYSTSITFSSP
jgi:Peptide-N-glycosidase F, C terminal